MENFSEQPNSGPCESARIQLEQSLGAQLGKTYVSYPHGLVHEMHVIFLLLSDWLAEKEAEIISGSDCPGLVLSKYET